MSDERLNRIEERIAWLERHVLQQDKAMMELSEANARLREQVRALQSRQTNSAQSAEGEAAAEDRPPHY